MPNLSINGKDYTIFISSESIRCFVCSDFGHIRQTCPDQGRPADAENSERAAGVDVAAAAGV